MTDQTQDTQLGGRPTELQGLDKWLTERLVTVVVGPEEKRWNVHEKLLISQSDFFKDHFAAGHDEMKLPDDDPKLFALFIRWLYGTAFLPVGGGARKFRFSQPDNKTTSVRDYLGVYVLGGKFGIVGVRNAVVEVLYNYYGESSDNHKCPSMHDVLYIFENTKPENHMRRFLVAHVLFYLFSKQRRNNPLPRDWAEVLNEHGDIGFSMIRMLAEWNWAMGHNAGRMSIKARETFYEKLPTPVEVIKEEEEEEEEEEIL